MCEKQRKEHVLIIDVIITAIMLVCLISGFRRGFARTLIGTLGWLVALVAAFFAADPVRNIVKEQTEIYDSIYAKTFEHFNGPADEALTYFNTLPDIINKGVSDLASSAADTVANAFADLILLIFCFSAVFILLKLLLFLILRSLAKRKRAGFIGFFDGVAGLAAGTVKGAVIVFALLALLMPAVNFVTPENAADVTAALNDSYIARMLYNNNFIMLFGKGLF